MRFGLGAVLLSSLVLAACQGRGPGPSLPSSNLVPGRWIEARAVKPPQQNVRVGSLYYARETPTERLDLPVAIEPLCFTALDRHEVQLIDTVGVASFDVTDSFSGGAGLSGIKTTLLSAGLKGDLSTYYDLKLTDVTKSGITRDDAQKIFEALKRWGECRAWFGKVDPNFAVYQIEAVYTGNLVLVRKQTTGGEADLSVRLNAIEPALTAKLKSEAGDSVTGKSMVFAIVPILRNSAAQ